MIISGLTYLLLFNYDASYLLLMAIFVISMAVNFGAALLVKANSAIPIVLAGLGLTILSFAYQSLGPEFNLSGTECRVIRECFDPVRGGGFPVQYVIDIPGITYWDVLGFEDEFRPLAFVADVCFYICLLTLFRWGVQRLNLNYTDPKARAG